MTHRLSGLVLLLLPALALAEDGARIADAIRAVNDTERVLPATDLFVSLQKCSGRAFDVAVQTHHDEAGKYTLSVAHGGKVVVSVEAWKGMPFFVNDQKQRLYYAVYSPGTSGGRIVAVDLATGKELWRSAVKGLEPVGHSKYSNQISLDGAEEVVIKGVESYGTYLEVKNADTGETLANRVLDRAK